MQFDCYKGSRFISYADTSFHWQLFCIFATEIDKYYVLDASEILWKLLVFSSHVVCCLMNGVAS